MGSKAPPPPDYQGAAAAQGAASQANTGAQTQANRPNQSTGFAGSQWTKDPSTGQWTESVGLSGPLGGAQGEAAQQLATNLGIPMDTGTQARDKAVQSVYAAETANLDPQMRLQQEENESNLANEGLSPTSAAYRAQENAENQAENQAYAGARANAEQLGTGVQQATFGENLAAREQPLQELQGLLGLEAQPGFQGAGVAQTPEYLAAAMGLGNYGLAANAQNNQLLGGLGQGGGQLLGAGMNFLSPAIVGAPFGL